MTRNILYRAQGNDKNLNFILVIIPTKVRPRLESMKESLTDGATLESIKEYLTDGATCRL